MGDKSTEGYSIYSKTVIEGKEKQMVIIKDIRIDYEKEPIGIIKLPQFSWRIESNQRNVLQTAYQLQISADTSFDTIEFDSENVQSSESAHVFAEGFKMESLKKYYVRVRINDNYHEISEWSKTSFFISAVMSICDWQGNFISAEKETDAASSKGTYLRKEFHTRNEVRSAYICITALGLYQLYLNGEKVGDDELTPGWTSYHKRLLYQTYDITQKIKTGDNVLGAILGAGWYKGTMGFLGERNNYGKQTALFAQLVITYTNGKTENIVTDESWQGTDSPILFSEIYDGEIYDARKEIDNWNRPNLTENVMYPVTIVEYDKSLLYPQAACKVRSMTQVKPISMFTTQNGEKVIDFGQNLTGWVSFKVCAKKDSLVELRCFEVLDSEGNVYLDNLRCAKQKIVYICKDDNQVSFQPHFTFQGFQYVHIINYPNIPKLDDFIAYAVHSDMEETGSFSCSNADINQLQHNILWGMKGNFLDIPTDCPQRNERLGWTGDAQIFCRTATFLMNTYTFFDKWLKDVKADQTKEGGIPHIVPDIITGKNQDDWLVSQGTHSAAGWADVAVINPWNLYLCYGDKRIIEGQYESMKAWIDFMRSHEVNGTWKYRLQFGDWVALDAIEGSYFGATPNELICTAYYAYSAGIFAKMANIIGKDEDSVFYQKLHERIKRSFQINFFDENGLMTAQTQTSHVIALYFDLVPEKFRKKTVEGLLRLLVEKNGHLVTGFLGTPYFCHALSQNGHVKEAYDLLLKDDFPSWLYQVNMGATTIWEHWDGKKPDGSMWSSDMNSFNHYAYGAIGDWLYRVAAGIEIDEKMPGYKHTIIAPLIGGNLNYVKASYRSIYGIIQVEWVVHDEVVDLEVYIPENTSADIILSQSKALLKDDGILFERKDNAYRGVIGSGEYHIQYQLRSLK